MKSWKTVGIALGFVAAIGNPTAHATFHFMQIQKVIGGVGGDTGAQAIQLRMKSANQNLLAGQARLVVYDATGSNPTVITTFPSPNPAGGSCREILIASDAFADTTNPPVDSAARDYGMDNLIPPSYLAAGSLTFETASGSIIYWRISWGGNAYTGPTTGSIANDGDGEFGPPFTGPLPSGTDQALEFTAACPPGTSSSNDADYSLSAGAGVFTNNVGDDFTVTHSSVPAVSEWGMVLMVLIILTGATLFISKRRTA